MPYTVNEGARLYWEEHGSGASVLLIMGLSFTHEMWFRILPSVTARYKVILFDNRGVGLSSAPRGPYSIRQMARDAMAVMDAAKISAAHIVGASMGGMIAQELALARPERVLSLVLGCTTYSGLLGHWPHFRYAPRDLRWFRSAPLDRERALRRLLYAEATPCDRIEEDFRIRAGCTRSAKGFFSQFAGILMWNSHRRLQRITAPTLVIHGAEDHLLPPENGRAIAARIPHAEFLLVPDAGHILITDQPELSARILLEFLDRQPRARAGAASES